MQQIQGLFPQHVQHMQTVTEQVLAEAGADALIIHAGSLRYSFLDDHAYPFRANPHFVAWVPDSHAHDSVLLIRAGHKPKLFHYQPDDYWHLPPADPQSWWADQFELESVTDPDAWLSIALPDNSLLIGENLTGGNRTFTAEQVNPPRVINLLHLARTRKTDYEVACVQMANQIAIRGHKAAERGFHEGLSEYAIHQRYLDTIEATDEDLPYNNIIGINEHGAVLHYQGRARDTSAVRCSFLIDAGAKYHGYAADITRTYVKSEGLFTDLLLALDEIQQVLVAQVTPGTDYRDLHLLTHTKIATLLESAGLVNMTPDEQLAAGVSSYFFPHGLGHFLGLQTHDVAGLLRDASGQEIPRPDGHPYLRLTRVLETGNVLTVEPGLYFIPTLLRQLKSSAHAAAVDWAAVDALLPYGGIRIEDNVVVTDDGPRNLTREAW